MGICARPGSRWARLPLTGLAGEGALCALLLCKSCFIRDIDRCGPMAALLEVHALRALSWAYMRIWGSAGSCHTPPQRSISRIKHDLHRRSAQSAPSPAKPVRGSRAQRLPGRAPMPMVGRAGQTRLGTRRPSVGGGRCPGIQGVARVRTMPGTKRICARRFALAASSYHWLTGYCFWSHADHAFVSNAPVPSASPDGELR